MWLQQTYRRHYTHAIKYIVHTPLQIQGSLIISPRSIQVLIENTRGTEILFKKAHYEASLIEKDINTVECV